MFNLVIQRPLVIIGISAVAGISLACQFSIGILLVITCFIFVIGLLMSLFIPPSKRFIWIKIWLCTAGICLVFMLYFYQHDMRNTSNIQIDEQDDNSTLQSITLKGQIVSPVEIDGDRGSFAIRVKDGVINEKLQVNVRFMTKEEKYIAREWERGDFISMSGNLERPNGGSNFGQFDYASYLRLQKIHWIFTSKGIDLIVVTKPEGLQQLSWTALFKWVDRTRELMGSALENIYSNQHSGFMQSLLLGLTDELDPEQFDLFAKFGLTHILAISGLHVAVFTIGVVYIMRWIGVSREMNHNISMGLIPLYILLSGASPSVLRAGIMAMIALYMSKHHKLKDALNIISVTAILLLIWNPYLILNVSFQLSFFVTVGLIVGVPIFLRLLPFSPRWLCNAIYVTTVAQLVSFPFTIYYFNQFSLLSWLINLLFVPIYSFIVLPLGYISLLFGMVSKRLAKWLADVNEFIHSGCLKLIEGLGERISIQLIWSQPEKWWIVVYFILLGCIIGSLMFRKKMNSILSITLFALLLTYGYVPDRFVQATSSQGIVQFIDVGQGDAILIRTPQGRTVLLDGGGTLTFGKSGEEWKKRRMPFEIGKKLLVPLLKKRGVHHIDELIISHADQDHIGGLQAVIEQIPVKRIWFNGTLKDNEIVHRFFRRALDLNIPLISAYHGITLQIDRSTTIDFMYPEPPEDNTTRAVGMNAKQNDESVIFLLRMFDYHFLFTGDMGQIVERSLLEKLPDRTRQQVDVIKIAHHGSKHSSSFSWLKYWQPRAAVISVGVRNTYGHPSSEVVDRLQSLKTAVFRTDKHGEIQFILTPDSLRVRTFFDILI